MRFVRFRLSAHTYIYLKYWFARIERTLSESHIYKASIVKRTHYRWLAKGTRLTLHDKKLFNRHFEWMLVYFWILSVDAKTRFIAAGKRSRDKETNAFLVPAWRWEELIIKTRLFQMSYRLFIIGGSLDVLNKKKKEWIIDRSEEKERKLTVKLFGREKERIKKLNRKK